MAHHRFALEGRFIQRNQLHVTKVGHVHLLKLFTQVVKPNTFISIKNIFEEPCNVNGREHFDLYLGNQSFNRTGICSQLGNKHNMSVSPQ